MAPNGIQEETLVPWLEANVPGLQGPLDFVLVAGGRSNLTFKVTDANGPHRSRRARSSPRPASGTA